MHWLASGILLLRREPQSPLDRRVPAPRASRLDPAASVFDIPIRTFSLDRRASAGTGVPGGTIQQRLSILSGCASRGFDASLTDPPYNRRGAELFLSRAVPALATNLASHSFFSFFARRPYETLRRLSARSRIWGVVTRR